MKSWKEAEAVRLERNEACRIAYRDQVKLWEVERDQAKLEKWRPAWNKPKLGKLEAPLPRPTLNDPEVVSKGQQDESDFDEHESDSGCE